MALTRLYKGTVLARIKRDRKFARVFFAGAIEMLLESETEEALSRQVARPGPRRNHIQGTGAADRTGQKDLASNAQSQWQSHGT